MKESAILHKPVIESENWYDVFTIGHFYQETSIPIMPNDLSEGFGDDPTLHRWEKGNWAKLCDAGVTAVLIAILGAPIFTKFGTIINQTNSRDETVKVFDIEFEKQLKGTRFDFKISPDSWDEIKSEMNAEATNDEIA